MSGIAAATRVVYESTVTAVGGQVEAFLDHGLLIFFGEESPAELHDMSVRHRPTVREEGPRPGDVIVLGTQELEVLAVGEVVADNLLNLGHLDLKADGGTEARLPGDVCVAVQPLPLLHAGDVFRIVRGGVAAGPAAGTAGVAS
ncbi:PTS glucitol/sorbitol transporter subunit IIA [Nocardioides mesophilus]|uniref:PTS glucitol/sorbitol transporter subunit IIA n=1 Tax=Nocardioides mesophilus TaxID=433659 RepID=A0A7G9RE47_9ACTN|nr:PTS glucitol/sorbitol transporter subunit IIA [Nocardioides mesophilus]QNN53872.1 PTS glucitol/sorbitol transporter subunit IIA [Nocardioides mesophilus]